MDDVEATIHTRRLTAGVLRLAAQFNERITRGPNEVIHRRAGSILVLITRVNEAVCNLRNFVEYHVVPSGDLASVRYGVPIDHAINSVA
jgi:hypothetical protein